MKRFRRGSILTTCIALAAASILAACGGGASNGDKSNASNTPGKTDAQQGTGGSSSGKSTDDGTGMDGDHSIIRQEAVGPLHIGEWKRPVMSFVYAITARAGRDSADIILVRGIGKDTASLTFRNDTLQTIFVTRAGPHTADGISVGTPFATLAADTGATTTKRGTAKVVTLNRLCGVEFATDSVALSQDSVVRKSARQPDTVRAISVGYCKH